MCACLLSSFQKQTYHQLGPATYASTVKSQLTCAFSSKCHSNRFVWITVHFAFTLSDKQPRQSSYFLDTFKDLSFHMQHEQFRLFNKLFPFIAESCNSCTIQNSMIGTYINLRRKIPCQIQ